MSHPPQFAAFVFEIQRLEAEVDRLKSENEMLKSQLGEQYFDISINCKVCGERHSIFDPCTPYTSNV